MTPCDPTSEAVSALEAACVDLGNPLTQVLQERVNPSDELAGRREAIWTTRTKKLATANVWRRAKTKEKKLASAYCCVQL